MRRWGIVLLMLLAGATGTVLTLPYEGGRPDAALLSLAAGAMLIGAFDVALPSGDRLRLASPFIVVAVAVYGPAWGVLVTTMAEIGARLGPIGDHARARWDSLIGQLVLLPWLYLVSRVSAAANPGGLPDAAVVAMAIGVSGVLHTAASVGSDSMLVHERIDGSGAASVLGYFRIAGGVIASQLSAGVLLGLTLRSMGVWATAVAAVLLLLVRQSFALLVEIKSAYRSTVQVLARAVEVQSAERGGHSERVAGLCAAAGRSVGMHGARLEGLTFAALFHDIAADDEGEGRGAADLLRDVNALSTALPILEVLDARGLPRESKDQHTLISAYLVASASDIDNEARGGTEPNTAGLVGALLYSSTRRSIDPAVRRMRRMAGLPAGSGRL